MILRIHISLAVKVCDLLSSSGLKLTKGLEDGETGSHAETKSQLAEQLLREGVTPVAGTRA